MFSCVIFATAVTGLVLVLSICRRANVEGLPMAFDGAFGHKLPLAIAGLVNPIAPGCMELLKFISIRNTDFKQNGCWASFYPGNQELRQSLGNIPSTIAGNIHLIRLTWDKKASDLFTQLCHRGKVTTMCGCCFQQHIHSPNSYYGTHRDLKGWGIAYVLERKRYFGMCPIGGIEGYGLDYTNRVINDRYPRSVRGVKGVDTYLHCITAGVSDLIRGIRLGQGIVSDRPSGVGLILGLHGEFVSVPNLLSQLRELLLIEADQLIGLPSRLPHLFKLTSHNAQLTVVDAGLHGTYTSYHDSNKYGQLLGKVCFRAKWITPPSAIGLPHPDWKDWLGALIGFTLLGCGCLIIWIALVAVDDALWSGLGIGAFGIICVIGGIDLIIFHGARLGV